MYSLAINESLDLDGRELELVFDAVLDSDNSPNKIKPIQAFYKQCIDNLESVENENREILYLTFYLVRAMLDCDKILRILNTGAFSGRVAYYTSIETLLGERQNDILKWFESLRDESIEFFEKCIIKRDLSGIVSTKLYRIVKDRICTLKEDENGILFIPYPIVEDFEGGFYLQFATDFISAFSERLVDEGIVGGRRLYYIYPSMVVNNYCLRSIDGDREFIDVPELEKYIIYTTCQ